MTLAEAEIFSNYLIGISPSRDLVLRYEAACAQLSPEGSLRDRKILSLAVRRPALLPFLDAGLAWGRHRNSLLRKKLLIMLALLETSAEHYMYFTSREYGKGKWLHLFFTGAGAAAKLVIGKLILIFV